MAGGSEGESFIQLPTYTIAGFLAFFLILSLGFEKLIHFMKHTFKKMKRPGLVAAIDAMVSELTVLGFVSLILLTFQDSIHNICVNYSPSTHTYWSLLTNVHGCDCCLSHTKSVSECLLEDRECGADFCNCNEQDPSCLVTDGPASTLVGKVCEGSVEFDAVCPAGKIPIVSVLGMHQIHLFIFVVALAHVATACVMYVLASWRVGVWKKWAVEEDEHGKAVRQVLDIHDASFEPAARQPKESRLSHLMGKLQAKRRPTTPRRLSVISSRAGATPDTTAPTTPAGLAAINAANAELGQAGKRVTSRERVHGRANGRASTTSETSLTPVGGTPYAGTPLNGTPGATPRAGEPNQHGSEVEEFASRAAQCGILYRLSGEGGDSRASADASANVTPRASAIGDQQGLPFVRTDTVSHHTEGGPIAIDVPGESTRYRTGPDGLPSSVDRRGFSFGRKKNTQGRWLTRQGTIKKRHQWMTEYLICFVQQFNPQGVGREDFDIMKASFVLTHRVSATFDFMHYIMNSMEDDFAKVVGISLEMWLILIVFIIVSGPIGWAATLFLAIASAIQIVVNTKLVQIIRHVCRGGRVNKLAANIFWFKKPPLLLIPISFNLFICSFMYGSLAFMAWQFGPTSCPFTTKGFWWAFPAPYWLALIWATLLFVDLSIKTLPMYSLAVQMGSEYKHHLIATSVKEKIMTMALRAKAQVKAKKAADKESSGHLGLVGANLLALAHDKGHALGVRTKELLHISQASSNDKLGSLDSPAQKKDSPSQ